jgi:hypothetical protein
MANDFYKNLFSLDGNEVLCLKTLISFPSLLDEDVVNYDEMKNAIFSMSSWNLGQMVTRQVSINDHGILLNLVFVILFNSYGLILNC